MAKNVPKRQNEKFETIKDIAPLKEILSSQEYTLFQDSANEEEKKLFESILLIADKFQESVSKTELNRSSVLARIIYDTLGNDLIDILSNEANLKKFKEKLSDSIKKDTTTEKVSDKEIDDIINKAVNDKISVLLGDSSKSSTKKISKEQQNLLDSFRKSFSGLEKTQNKIYKKNRELYNNILTFSKKLKSLNVSQTTAKKSATSISSITTSKKETEKISKTVKTDTNKSESHDTSIASTEKEVTNLITFNLSSVQNLNDQITAQQKGVEKQNKKDEKKRKSFLSKLLSGTIFLLAAPLIIMGKTLFAIGKAVLWPLKILAKFTIKGIFSLFKAPFTFAKNTLTKFYDKTIKLIGVLKSKFLKGALMILFTSKTFYFFLGFIYGKFKRFLFPDNLPDQKDSKIQTTTTRIKTFIKTNVDEVLTWLFGENWREQREENGFLGALKIEANKFILNIRDSLITLKTTIENTDIAKELKDFYNDIKDWYKRNEDYFNLIGEIIRGLGKIMLVATGTWVGAAAIGGLAGIYPKSTRLLATLIAIGVALAAYGISSLFKRKDPDDQSWETFPTSRQYLLNIGKDITKDKNIENQLKNFGGSSEVADHLMNANNAIKERSGFFDTLFNSTPLKDKDGKEKRDSKGNLIYEKDSLAELRQLLRLTGGKIPIAKLDNFIDKLFDLSFLGINDSSEYKNWFKANIKTIDEVEAFAKSLRNMYSVLAMTTAKMNIHQYESFFSKDNKPSRFLDIKGKWTETNYGALNKLIDTFIKGNKKALPERAFLDLRLNNLNKLQNFKLFKGKIGGSTWQVNYGFADQWAYKWNGKYYPFDVSLYKNGSDEAIADLVPGFDSNGLINDYISFAAGEFLRDTNDTIPVRASHLKRFLEISDNPTTVLTPFSYPPEIKGKNGKFPSQEIYFTPVTTMYQLLSLLKEYKEPGLNISNVKKYIDTPGELYKIQSIMELSKNISESDTDDYLRNIANRVFDKNANKHSYQDSEYLIYILYKILEASQSNE